MVAKSDGPANLYCAEGTAADANEPVAISERDGLEVPTHDEHGYRIREQPMGTKRKVKVIVQGAGASALNFFQKAEEEMTHLDITCYEKNADVGGTVSSTYFVKACAKGLTAVRQGADCSLTVVRK